VNIYPSFLKRGNVKMSLKREFGIMGGLRERGVIPLFSKEGYGEITNK